MKRLILLVFIFSCFYACSDEDNSLIATEIDIVTGMNLIDSSGNNAGIIGNPNVFRDNIKVAVYPNPAIRVLFIKSDLSIKNVWILKGILTKDFSNTDFNTTLKSDQYTSAEIKNKSIFDIENLDKRNISIDLARFDKGFYRVFIELEDGSKSWNNIYFGSSQINEINYWK